MNTPAICGWIATLLFALSYVPQIIYTYKTKKVGDISVSLWWILLVAYSCGMWYGIDLRQWQLISGYLWGWACSSTYLVLYYKYRGKI